VDAVYTCGTDFGTQAGLYFSLDTVKTVFMPYYKKLNDWIHQNTNWKIIKHSCGANREILPLFIEAGFDAFTPVQTSAAGMDPEDLKKDFGKDIVFWGGCVDVQKILPFGSPQEVYDQVMERLDIFARDGGYVFNAIHNVQPGVPVRNLEAMFKAYDKFNGI
jgi:uroporphyrinogen-III decarboxylase